ncbi:MAG: alpha/beta fold hydrolase [Chitinophagales bacterium]|nr:alpha/beta fold hydrolase [Hyphomicrobiales bacterium]
MPSRSEKITFPGSQGFRLAARLDYPDGEPKAMALFAHCFTCSKDIFAASRIAGELADRGFAVLRFDFTGLGMSGGEFANTNFSSNVQDIVAAADYLRQNMMPADILIGHSLGGAAVLAAAGDIPEVKAVATIGAPSDAAHVIHNFAAHVDEIRDKGEASVSLAGRQFTIKKQFLDDLAETRAAQRIGAMRKALLIFHAPTDNVVGLDNASAIFAAAKHPKSFISLHGADHLLSKREDAAYVAEVLSAWASRYVMGKVAESVLESAADAVTVTETRRGKFQQEVRVGAHRFIADEPASAGGNDTGPTPYDLLAAALGACTAMTLRVYAEFKNLPLDRVQVNVRHNKDHMADCKHCMDETAARIDHFERSIAMEGDLTDEARAKLLAIADRCPVHRTLEKGAKISTKAGSKNG